MIAGHKLRRYREAAKITQKQLSTQSGYDQAFISRVENNETGGTVEFWRAMASALNVPVSEFLGDAKDIADLPDDVVETAAILKGQPPRYREIVKALAETLIQDLKKRGEL